MMYSISLWICIGNIIKISMEKFLCAIKYNDKPHKMILMKATRTQLKGEKIKCRVVKNSLMLAQPLWPHKQRGQVLVTTNEVRNFWKTKDLSCTIGYFKQYFIRHELESFRLACIVSCLKSNEVPANWRQLSDIKQRLDWMQIAQVNNREIIELFEFLY